MRRLRVGDVRTVSAAVNASRPPGEWQAYDIVFTSPRFGGSGKLDKPAIVTVLHNGIVVPTRRVLGPTQPQKNRPVRAGQRERSDRAADHGNPIRYRNIWIRPLAANDE